MALNTSYQPENGAARRIGPKYPNQVQVGLWFQSDYRYYLRGRVYCPHCGCPYTQGSARGRTQRVHYYACLSDQRRKTKCPVARINADNLHGSILRALQYAASHPTTLHKLIAQSGGWGNADAAQHSLRGQLAKKRQFNALQIGNLTRAIAEGGNMRSLLATLERLEREQADIQRQIAAVEKEIEAATIPRPTAAGLLARSG